MNPENYFILSQSCEPAGSRFYASQDVNPAP
jgi:hypothetical protein